MKFVVALYLLSVTLSLDVPAAHDRCGLVCEATREAAQAQIGSNYKHEHKRAGVSAAEQIKRDRERLALLIIEREIARAKKRTL